MFLFQVEFPEAHMATCYHYSKGLLIGREPGQRDPTLLGPEGVEIWQLVTQVLNHHPHLVCEQSEILEVLRRKTVHTARVGAQSHVASGDSEARVLQERNPI